jgi:hypothetical protein
MSLVKTIKNIDKINKENYNEDNIYLITQFYISNNKERQKEILYCLKRNIELNLFSKIYLINEREYSLDEMGITEEENKNIQQIIFQKGQRMKYIHSIALVKIKKLNGYIITANSDIFFDKSLLNIRKTSLSISKSFYALLRFEFDLNNINLNECKLFEHNVEGCSQDTWIFHSNFLPSNIQALKCNFMLGQMGCDNSIAFLFHSFGFKVYNEPYIIKTYHYHTIPLRTYTKENKIDPPYLFINPIIRNTNLEIIKI